MQLKNRAGKICLLAVTASMLWLIFAALVLAENESPIDWEKARVLNRKEQRGETLTDEERAYLERAKELRQSRARQPELLGRA